MVKNNQMPKYNIKELNYSKEYINTIASKNPLRNEVFKMEKTSFELFIEKMKCFSQKENPNYEILYEYINRMMINDPKLKDLKIPECHNLITFCNRLKTLHYQNSETLQEEYQLGKNFYDIICSIMNLIIKNSPSNYISSIMFSNKPYKIAVLGFKTLSTPWDSFTEALPGSEECMVYGCNELASQGHLVHIFADPPKFSSTTLPISNPRWFPSNEFLFIKGNYDIVILWRSVNTQVVKIAQPNAKILFWAHDAPRNYRNNLSELDGALWLSYSVRKRYISCNPDFIKVPFTVAGNGVILEQFTKPMSFTNKFSIGYFSSYYNGLEQLLMIWPNIKRKFPKATLDIFYGREHWGCMSQDKFEWVINKIQEYSSLGVTENGKLDHITLAKRMQEISVFAYPCTVEETFCITAIKCQASGMVCVTNQNGALPETIRKGNSVIEDFMSRDLTENSEILIKFENLLLQKLEQIKNNDPVILEERLANIEFSKNWSWKNVCNRWVNFFDKVTSNTES